LLVGPYIIDIDIIYIFIILLRTISHNC